MPRAWPALALLSSIVPFFPTGGTVFLALSARRLLAGLSVSLLVALAVLLVPPSVAFADPAFRLAVISERAGQPEFVVSQYAGLLTVLRRELATRGIEVAELTIARDVAEMRALLAAGRVDAVLESLLTSLRIDRAGTLLDPTLAAWRKGRRETRTFFFVRNDSPVRSLADLAGRRLALESPRSTTAYALPRMVLRQHGLRVVADDDAQRLPGAVRCVLVGAEINQAYWVARGRADAGAFNAEDWEMLPVPLRGELRVIHETDSILRWIWSFRRGLAPGTRQAVEAALLRLHLDSAGARVLGEAGQIRRFDRIDADDARRIEAWRRSARAHGFGD